MTSAGPFAPACGPGCFVSVVGRRELRRGGGTDVLAVSFNGDVGGVVTLFEALLVELARLGEAGTGISSVRGELGFFPFALDGITEAG